MKKRKLRKRIAHLEEQVGRLQMITAHLDPRSQPIPGWKLADAMYQGTTKVNVTEDPWKLPR